MELLILVGLLVLNGLFAMSELAVVSARKARLQVQADEGEAGAKAALQLLEAPDRFLSTVQIGITLIGTVAGVFGGSTLAEELADWLRANVPDSETYADAMGAVVIILLTTYLSLVIGELVPKRLAMQNPERIAARAARPMQLLSRLASPLVTLLSLSTSLVIRVLGVQPSDEPAVTENEVLSMIEQGIEGGVFEASEQQMVQGVFDLDVMLVREIITPRRDIVWFRLDDTREEIRQKVLNKPFSAYPICGNDLDDVLGVAHTKRILLALLSNEALDLRRVMQPALFIPETVTLSALLRRFKEAGTHLALIVDEHGGTDGLVTLNDIVEEILGYVGRAEPQMVRREDGSYLVDGFLTVARFQELFSDFPIPEDETGDYQSIAGFVLTRLGRIPAAGDHFHWHRYRVEVMDMDGVRVDKLLLQKTQITQPEG
jgi:putative hemolysin